MPFSMLEKNDAAHQYNKLHFLYSGIGVFLLTEDNDMFNSSHTLIIQ